MPWKGNLPQEMPPGVGKVFRDYVPESEQDDHPGQGMGALTPDYVPEGFTAAEWLDYSAKKRELQELERAQRARSGVRAAEQVMAIVGAEEEGEQPEVEGDRPGAESHPANERARATLAPPTKRVPHRGRGG